MSIGSFSALFFLAGVVTFISSLLLATWIDRRRFAGRFERLVRSGRVVPVFTRGGGKDGKTVARARVTLDSLLETWVTEPVTTDPRNWKVRSPRSMNLITSIWRSILSDNETLPQPIAAQYIIHEEEDNVVETILGTGSRRREAKRFINSVQRRRWLNKVAKPRARQASEEIGDGEIRACTLVLMPSPSRRQYQGEGEVAEKRARRFAATSSRISSEVTTSDGKFQGAIDVTTPTTLLPVEIGITQSIVPHASEIYELLRDGEESVVSLEDDYDVMPAILGPQNYRVVYGAGRTYLVPSRLGNPLLGNNLTRVY